MTDTILVPTDGSGPAGAAAQHARLLATELDAAVHVLSVVSGAGVADGTNPRTTAEGVAADAASLIGGEDASATETAIEPTTTVREGDPAETILAYTDEISANLVVMGTHGRTGVGRVVSGSVTEHVTRHSETPVFTVRGDTAVPTRYERLLFPTDGSNCAEAAVAQTTRLATAFDATVEVVSVVDVNTVAAQSELTNARPLVNELETQSETAVERVADRFHEAGVSAETAVLQGTPAAVVADRVVETGADLVVMGTHGRTGVGRILLGSTTERLIRHAAAPVLSVRADDTEERGGE